MLSTRKQQKFHSRNVGRRIKDSVVHGSYARLTVVAELYCWGSPILGIGMACQKLCRQGRDDAKSKAPSLHLFTLWVVFPNSTDSAYDLYRYPPYEHPPILRLRESFRSSLSGLKTNPLPPSPPLQCDLNTKLFSQDHLHGKLWFTDPT